MWFVPGLWQPDYNRRDAWDQWGPSLPAAVLTGLSCAYISARLKPLLSSSHEDDKKNEYILQDLHNAKSFLTNLWNTKAASQSINTEAISKAGEDVLLHRGGARRTSPESVTATLTIAAGWEQVEGLRRRMGAMGRAEQVHCVTEVAGAVQKLLQTRLPVTASLLSQAFEVARLAVALDAQATLQLGSWGVIMQSGGEVKLLRLQDGDAPVLLDSFRDEGDDLRVEGLYLRGVQMRAAMGESSAVTLRSKMLLKVDEIDALVVWPPVVTLSRASMLYATKIVEFKGVTAVVRSNLVPVSFNAKLKHEDHTGLYLVAAIAFLVALMPSALWLPILGQIGIVFLPILQMAAVILGWNVGHLLVLGEWPRDREVRLDSKEELKEFGNNLYKYISPWDSAVRMEMGDLERHLARKLEAQPSVSNAGVFAQPADYRTEFWRKGLGEMDQAIEMEPKNELPFRIRGCIKGLAGNYEGALQDLDQALKLKPDDVLALVDRGVFRFLGGDLVGALADLDQAIKHDPAQPADVLKLRDAIAKDLADREELAQLREENPKLKAELEALRAKAAADLEAAQAKAAADLEAAQAKAAADLEAARAKAAADLEAAQAKAAADLQAAQDKAAADRVKAEAEAADLRAKNQKLQEDLDKAQEALSKIPSNQTLELQYNNLCCEKCVRDIKSALSKVPGVESVEEDFMTSKVTVTGYISASVILSVCRQTSPKKVIFIVGDQNAPQAAPSRDEEPQIASAAPEPTTPEPAAAPAPEPELETKSEPAPDEAKPESVAPEAKPESVAPEAKPETVAPEAKPETKSEPAAEAKPETVTEPAPGEAKPETKPEPEIEPETAAAGSDTKPESASEPAPDEAKPESSSEPAPETSSEPAAKPEPANSEAKPEPRWEPAPESKAEPSWIADPESRGEGAPVPEAVVAGEAKEEANSAAEKPKENGEAKP